MILENKETTYLYLICEDLNDFNLYLKIGISNNVDLRFIQLDTGPIKRYKILSTYQFKNRKIALENEFFLHKLLKEFNTRGEWFLINKNQLKIIDDLIVEFLKGFVEYDSNFRNEYFNYKINRNNLKI